MQHELPPRRVVLQGRPKKGFTPYRLDEFLCGATFTMYEFLMRSCGQRRAIAEARKIHQHIEEHGHGGDRFLANLLVQMYGQCGSAESARAVFDRIVDRNIFSWTLMIAAYAQNGHDGPARRLFQEMDLLGQAADRIALIAMLGVCARMGLLREGRIIHERIAALGFATEMVAATAIFTMYARCGCLRWARTLFEELAEKSIVSWNAMIAAYAQQGHPSRALQIFRRLDQEGIAPDEMSFSGLLAALASKQCLAKGRILHARIVASGLELLPPVANPLVNFYTRCGCLGEARRIFDAIPRKSVVSWNTMIAAYAGNGNIRDALDLFARIGVAPDWISFAVVLQACSHAGLVDQAWDYLLSMRSKHGIEPCGVHYSHMVDILGKAGKLDDAERLIDAMPIEADAVVWRSLLGACKIHGDVERGTRAALRVIPLEPRESGPYILLANLYAASGRLNELDKVRKMMRERCTSPASVDARMDDVVRETSVFESARMHEKLRALNARMQGLRLTS